MKLAIVADWLPTYGGAEHVIAALNELWPKAPIFTTVARRERLGPLRGAALHTDLFLQFLFRLTHRHQYLLPWMPLAVESIDLRAYDLILSSSHAVAKGILPSPRSVHVCYCHTPMRYAWEMEEEYLTDFRIRGPLKAVVKSELKRLRRWDLSTAKRVDSFIANSTETQQRIANIYGRESVVVPPPVEDRFFQTPLPPATGCPPCVSAAGPEGGTYFLALGRLVPYKRFDLLIHLANALHLPLKIGGMGGDSGRLKRLAGPTIEFLGFVKDEDLPALYAHAECLLFPQVEDAGIVPLEALASGTPVIAYAEGGVADIVVDGQTGLLVSGQTMEAFSAAVTAFGARRWDRAAIRAHARRFQLSTFKQRIAEEVDMALRRGFLVSGF